MDEFSFIQECLAPLAGPEGLGLLDDAAVMTPRFGYDLVLTKDTMVEGVHFPDGEYGADVAGKLLRVNLSDIAAKGAHPIGYLLSIAWPRTITGGEFNFAAREFARGLEGVQTRFGFPLFGGDTVRNDGPMVISATLIGEVPSGKMVRRSGAKPGDDVWVSGTIGDAYLGLHVIQSNDTKIRNATPTQRKHWLDAYWRPVPRLGLQDILMDIATASADISDGLISDIGHIAKASGVRADLDLSMVPISDGAESLLEKFEPGSLLIDMITGGDDYEIAFTADSDHRTSILERAKAQSIRVTRIGQCAKGQGVQCRDEKGRPVLIKRPGYAHF